MYTNAPKQLREAISTNLCTLLRPHGRSHDPRESQQCTQMPQNGAEGPFPPICVHSCVPQASCVTGRGHGSHDVDGPHDPRDVQFLLNQNTRVLWAETHATAPVTSSLPGR